MEQASKALVSWGHDWVVLCLIVVYPFWAPTKVFALPIAARLYINRQGLAEGKKGKGKAAKEAKAEPKPKAKAKPRRKPSPRRIPIIAPGRNWPWNSSVWRPGGTPLTRSSSWVTAPTAVAAS